MIRDILLIQKRELENKSGEVFIERIVDYKKFNNDLIKIITGPRRAGKSFLGIHVLNKIGNFGYVNFDDENLIELKDYNEIITMVNSIYNNPKYLLFDEIQNLPKWELFVNRLKRQGFNLIITGSNSNLLSKELSTHLTGRYLSINVFPFSFKEYLKLETKELTDNEIQEKLFMYLTFGGYPEPAIKKIDYKEYLNTLFNSIVYKDIVKRYNIRFISGMDNLASYLISNIAKEFSYNTLAQITKCKSVHTIEKYLSYLEEAFIFFKINRFSFKLKEQICSCKKIYCIDNGFIYAKAFKLSMDIGRLYENIVAINLKIDELNDKYKIYYWKNLQQEEVDFIIKHGIEIIQLVQVCYDITSIKTKEREERALIKASQELKCDNLLIITENYENEEDFEWFNIKRKIKFIPLWKWLLNKK
jgi:predicted AAA+ superfamily ATPase